jgi:hypothetical protein
VPQVEQLLGSRVVSVQAVPHRVKPATQAEPHALEVQVGVAFAGVVQRLPQAPQSSGELVMSTQAPLQFMRVPMHVAAHPVLPQTWPAGQTVAQVPQWFGSLVVSTQAPSQGE